MSLSFERAESYLSKVPGAGAGQRNAEAFRISAMLQKDFSLFEDEAWELLSRWALTCTPPLAEDELAACLKNGARYGSAVPGSKGASFEPQREKRASRRHEESFPEDEEPSIQEFESGSQIIELLQSREPFMPRHRQGRFVRFGLPTFDKLCPTARGELGIVAAGTGVGKSTLATQALLASARAEYKSALVSLEMIKPQVLARIGAHVTGVDHTVLFEHGGGNAELMSDGALLLNRVFFLCGMSGFNFTDMERSIEKAVKDHGISSVWIDYFTLVQPPNLSRQTGSAQIYADLSKSFKRMAQRLDISVVILAQFNRTFQGGGEKPTMYNLKETSQLEQDASWVMVIWQDAQDKYWASLDKNRMGKSGVKMPLVFNHACQRIREMTEDEMGGLSDMSPAKLPERRHKS